jgi:hypothetical protein
MDCRSAIENKEACHMKMRHRARLLKRRLPRRRRPFGELLAAMPNVGRDEDFRRAED